jgi:hypothetical protein
VPVQGVYAWRDLLRWIQQQPAGTILRLEKWRVEHPLDGGLRPGLGLPMGQRADFRLRLSDCSGLHVRDFGTHYEAHVDQVDPSCGPLEHLVRDAPNMSIAGAGALGALLGSVLGKSKEATLAGGFLGALIAFAAVDAKRKG